MLKAYRGQNLVDQLYQFGLPHLKAKGVQQCTLEVITQNSRAVRVYERIGFSISHRLKCYRGNLASGNKAVLHACSIDELGIQFVNHHYSWDHKKTTIQNIMSDCKAFKVHAAANSGAIGYFIIKPSNGTILQLETYTHNWGLLFDGISQICSEIRIINIHEKRKKLLGYLQQIDLQNNLDQFAMEMLLSN